MRRIFLIGLVIVSLATPHRTGASASPEDTAEFRPAEQDMLLHLRDHADNEGIRRHAWNVLLQVTRPKSGKPTWQTGMPIWQTWNTVPMVFRPSGLPAEPSAPPAQKDQAEKDQKMVSRQLELQLEIPEAVIPSNLSRALLENGIAPATEVPRSADPVAQMDRIPFSSIYFNRAASKFIREKSLFQKTRLSCILKDQRSKVQSPQVPEFPTDAVVVKAAWWLVHKNGRTALPVWDPPEPGPRKLFYTMSDWKRCVAIDPHPSVEGPHTDTMPCTSGQQPRQMNVVPLSRFYYFSVTPEMLAHLAPQVIVKNVNDQQTDPKNPMAFAVLIGLHITTKEIPQWAWETIWWHDKPQQGRFAADRPSALKGPWTNYLMDATLSADTPREPDDGPKICFNPYLEGQLKNGIVANCVNCHQNAAYPDSKNEEAKVGRGIQPPIIDGTQILLDFLWSMSAEPPAANATNCPPSDDP